MALLSFYLSLNIEFCTFLWTKYNVQHIYHLYNSQLYQKLNNGLIVTKQLFILHVLNYILFMTFLESQT